MAKKNRPKKTYSSSPSLMAGLAKLTESFLHPHPAEDKWRFLPHFLAAAFVLRALVALLGDFVIHPDEIMQYLEPAHKQVFGSGVTYWEYFYGARSWLVPGLVAGMLWLCQAVGLDSPLYYIAAVKLLFCLLSLLVPWGMYVFARHHWHERTARMALVLGVFWYELVGFAHKPMTEFVATSLIFLLLAISPMAAASAEKRPMRAALVGLLGALIVAIRFQYAPAVALILLAEFLLQRNYGRVSLMIGALFMVAVVGALEWATWGAPFHSYYINYQMNVIVGAYRGGESSIWQFPLWMLTASLGLVGVAVWSAMMRWRRRGFVVVLMLLILLPHMMQNHREYRFIFVAIPLWLLLFADFFATAIADLRHREKQKLYTAGVFALPALLSLLGIFNQLPWQQTVYTGFSLETGKTNFIIGQDPVFSIYRNLSADSATRGVLDSSRPYFNTGGYYYLHRDIPFYDASSWRGIFDVGEANDYVSHIITRGPLSPVRAGANQRGEAILETKEGVLRLPAFVYDKDTEELTYWNARGRRAVLGDYGLAEQSGYLTVWKSKTDNKVRTWQSFSPIAAGGLEDVMRRIMGNDAKKPPQNYGIRFKDDN